MIRAEETPMDYIWKLYSLAQKKDLENGFEFEPTNYQLVLGRNIIVDLSLALQYINHKDEPSTVFDIPVTINYANPTDITLWKNVTEELY